MKRKRVLITAGGTGGHIFPAQGLAQQLMDSSFQHEVLFVAGKLAANPYFDRSQFAFRSIASYPISLSHPLTCLKGGWNLLKGCYQSMQVIKEFCPDVVVGFGSYYTASMLLAAKCLKIPIVLHEANSIPGKANKWFAPYAAAVGVHFPYTQSLLKAQTIEVGMPLRKGYEKGKISKEEARKALNLEAEKTTVVIFGGSQGAQAINQLIEEAIDLDWKPIQFIHLTGKDEAVPRIQALYNRLGIRACVKAFEKQMNIAWSAADAFIGRSGASTIAECMEFEVPGLLIPYPSATDNHQEKNADFIIHTVKGGIKCLQHTLTGSQLKDICFSLLINPVQLQQMTNAIQSYKQRDAKLDLCELVLQIAEKRKLQ